MDLVDGAREQALLDNVEERLDRSGFRAAARLGVLWQTRTRRREPSPEFSLDSVAPAELVPALSAALAAGAFESAEQLMHRLLAIAEPARLTGRGVVLAAETLLMLGEREKARSLAEAHADAMVRDARGAAVLELVGSPRAPDFLPDGRPSLLRLSRRLARGELAAGELADLIGSRFRTWLRTPELHLLFFSALVATDPARALRFLNRFLALHGLSTCTSLRDPDSTGSLLGRLHFTPRGASRAQGPLVSVLVAAHNSANTIGFALDSLLNQSYQPIEILVGDDASDDATLEILKQRGRTEPRLRVFRSDHNQGPYNLKNALAQRARGELLAFHDADDFALPDRIARQVAHLQGSSNVASIANFARVRPNGSFVFFRDQRAVRLGMVTLMLSRRAFASVGPFRSARVGADLELYAALRARFGPEAVARVRAPLMLGLWSSGSATHARGTESLDDGYRSPARRAYSQLVVGKYSGHPSATSRQSTDSLLRATGNFAEPAEVWETASLASSS